MKNRILVIDDNRHIFEDFRKILDAQPEDDQQINELEEIVFGENSTNQTIAGDLDLQLDYANQGEAGYEKALRAHAEGHRYFMAFVDVRMPPGMDGVQTIKKLWHEFPDMPCVICTAHSDYEWHQLVEQLGRSPNLLVLRKPFDPIEVRQIVLALFEQNRLTQMSNRLMESITHSAQTIHKNQTERLDLLADEFRAPLVSVLSYGERLLASNFDEETRQLEVNRMCAHTRFLLDLLDKFSGDPNILSPQSLPVERQRCDAGQLLNEVHQSSADILNKFGRDMQTKTNAGDEEIKLPRTALRNLLVNLIDHVVTRSVGTDLLEARVEYLPIVVNSTLQFSISDPAPAISTDSESWSKLLTLAKQAECTLTVLSGETTNYVVSLSIREQAAVAAKSKRPRTVRSTCVENVSCLLKTHLSYSE